jgi:hypothetical protein
MTFSIDPPRRVGPVRRSRKAAAAKRTEESARTEIPNLPVPVDEPASAPPPEHEPISGTSAIQAQLLGQKGARRGLRAGAALINAAKSSYEQINWSGSKDRRTPKGRIAKTDV